MNSMKTLLAAPAILFLLACAGSSSSTPAPQVASSIAYTDPTPAAGEWALVKDTGASTSKRLVLNLIGPTGALFRGVGFNLKADPTKVAFSRFRDDAGVSLGYMIDKGVLHDLDEASRPVPCITSVAGVRADLLSVGIWQKCLRFEIPPEGYAAQPSGSRIMNDAMDCSTTPVLQVALDLAQGATPGEVALTVTKAAIIPNHGKNVDLPLKATVRVGNLSLRP